MSTVLNDLQSAFALAANADWKMVLLPLIIVAIAQGLRAEGIRDVLSMTTRGLFWFGLAVFLFGGLLSAGRFSAEGWKQRSVEAWSAFTDLRFLEAMGFWLLLLAVITLVFLVRSVVRR